MDKAHFMIQMQVIPSRIEQECHTLPHMCLPDVLAGAFLVIIITRIIIIKCQMYANNFIFPGLNICLSVSNKEQVPGMPQKLMESLVGPLVNFLGKVHGSFKKDD